MSGKIALGPQVPVDALLEGNQALLYLQGGLLVEDRRSLIVRVLSKTLGLAEQSKQLGGKPAGARKMKAEDVHQPAVAPGLHPQAERQGAGEVEQP